MEPFSFYLPTRVLFGNGVLEQGLSAISSLGTHAFIVTGKNSTKQSGLLDRITGVLNRMDVVWTVYDAIPQNPKTADCEQGAAAARAAGADIVLGVGGGSPLDAAKAIAVLATNGGKTADYFGEASFSMRPLPVVAVPTTCGTGSEVTRYAVIIDETTRTKKTISSDAIIPMDAIVDPDLLITLPPHLVAGAGMDALSHAIEGFLSKKANPITHMYSRTSIRLVTESLVRATAGEKESLTNLMLGSLCAGFVINHTGTIMVHGMGYALTINYGIHHGTANALLLPYVLAFLSQHGYKEKIASLGETASFTTLRSLLRATGLPLTLAEAGVKQESLAQLAKEAATGCERSFKNMQSPFTPNELKNILFHAWSGTPIE